MARFLFATYVVFAWLNPMQAQIPWAHAHNDYQHDHPLQDALDHGFMSVEADIHLIEGELYVYHDHPSYPDPNRTLEQLYLTPLARRIKMQDGKVYRGTEQPFLLLVDIKTEAEATYAVLREKLKTYRSVLRRYNNDVITQSGAFMVVLSGNRPIATLQGETERLAAIDGRPSDLGKGYSAAFMPLISDHYRNQLSWRGKGKIEAGQLEKLSTLSQKVHDEGKLLRLWATPEKEKLWSFLLEGGVDYLNTDRLKKLKKFSKNRP